MQRYSDEKRSVTSAGDAGSSVGGSMERQSPQLDVEDAADAQSPTDQQQDPPAGQLTVHSPQPRATDDVQSSPDVEDLLVSCSPTPTTTVDDSRQPGDDSRPTVGESPPPLPSPPPVSAAADDDDETTAALVITDVAKYVSKYIGLIGIRTIGRRTLHG